MKLFLVAWLAFECPKMLGIGLVPRPLQPFACTAKVEQAFLSKQDDVDRLLRDLAEDGLDACAGAPVGVQEIRDGRKRDVEIVCERKLRR